jgi:hypothetical protein
VLIIFSNLFIDLGILLKTNTIMVSKFSILGLIIWFSSCEQAAVTPTDELTGKWKLIKTVNGFVRDISQKEKLASNVETIEFNNNATFQRVIDGKIIKESSYSIGGNETFKTFIKYTSDNTYQPFRIEEVSGKKQLILYEIMPVGAVLADGSDYYYEKL